MQARSNQNQKTICHRLLCREFLTSGPVEPVVCGGKCTTVRYGAVWAHIACPSHQWSNRWSNPWCRAVGPEAAASPFRPRAPGTRARLSHVRHSPLQRPLGRPLVQPPVGGCVPTRPHGLSLCSNAFLRTDHWFHWSTGWIFLASWWKLLRFRLFASAVRLWRPSRACHTCGTLLLYLFF